MLNSRLPTLMRCATYPVESPVEVSVRVNEVTRVVGALVMEIVVGPMVRTVLDEMTVLMVTG